MSGIDATDVTENRSEKQMECGLFKLVLQCWPAYCSSDLLVHSCINVKKPISCNWTVAGLQSFQITFLLVEEAKIFTNDM